MTASSDGGPASGGPASGNPCTRVRSTLLVGSIKALRERGHVDRYKALVDAAHRDTLFTPSAPSWLPLQVAQAHYAACDALALPTDEILQIGAVVAPIQASGVGVVLRAAHAGGVTPWTLLNSIQRYWGRMYDGSLVSVRELGPKDAQILVADQPLARSRYWRVGLRGILHALATSLSTKAYAQEVPGAGRDQVRYSIAWV